MKAIVARLGAGIEIRVLIKMAYIETRGMMVPSYSWVCREVKEWLIKGISEDLEFYYTLFPGSHIDILYRT